MIEAGVEGNDVDIRLEEGVQEGEIVWVRPSLYWIPEWELRFSCRSVRFGGQSRSALASPLSSYVRNVKSATSSVLLCYQ